MKETLEEIWRKAVTHPDVTDYWVVTEALNPWFQDSIWYSDTVLSITYMNRFILTIVPVGEVVMQWGESVCSTPVIKDRWEWLNFHDIHSDEDIARQMSSGMLHLKKSNWFEFHIQDTKQELRHIEPDYDVWEAKPIVRVDSQAIVERIYSVMTELGEEEYAHSIFDWDWTHLGIEK